MNYFTKLPNELFYKEVGTGDSILKQVKNDKVVLVLDYLYTNTNRRDNIKFTLEDMVVSCGFKIGTKKGESIFQFRDILVELQKLEIIKSKCEMKDIKPKELVTCTLTIDLTGEFVSIFDSEKEKILNQTIEKTDNFKLLVYYCYLKSRIYKRSKKENESGSTSGRKEVTWVGYSLINSDLGLSDETIKKYNDVLIAINLIRIDNAGTWYYSDDRTKFPKESSNMCTLYTADEKVWKKNLKEGIEYYKSLDVNSNKVFTNSKTYKNNDKKLNGELGSIIKKENNGTATEKDLQRKIEIENAKVETIQNIFAIKRLFEQNPGELLSDIYEELEKSSAAEKFLDIEISLGVVNDDNTELLVDYDYYKWVMTNYSEDKHEYYMGCVKKHIESNMDKVEMVGWGTTESKVG